ncbi:unnamed protein product, partial [Cyprideis torosa]
NVRTLKCVYEHEDESIERVLQTLLASRKDVHAPCFTSRLCLIKGDHAKIPINEEIFEELQSLVRSSAHVQSFPAARELLGMARTVLATAFSMIKYCGVSQGPTSVWYHSSLSEYLQHHGLEHSAARSYYSFSPEVSGAGPGNPVSDHLRETGAPVRFLRLARRREDHDGRAPQSLRTYPKGCGHIRDIAPACPDFESAAALSANSKAQLSWWRFRKRSCPVGDFESAAALSAISKAQLPCRCPGGGVIPPWIPSSSSSPQHMPPGPSIRTSPPGRPPSGRPSTASVSRAKDTPDEVGTPSGDAPECSPSDRDGPHEGGDIGGGSNLRGSYSSPNIAEGKTSSHVICIPRNPESLTRRCFSRPSVEPAVPSEPLDLTLPSVDRTLKPPENQFLQPHFGGELNLNAFRPRDFDAVEGNK